MLWKLGSWNLVLGFLWFLLFVFWNFYRNREKLEQHLINTKQND